MKIFIGHSFKKEDKDIVEKFKRFIQSLNYECITGEQSAILSVSQKVQERIKQCDILLEYLPKKNHYIINFWKSLYHIQLLLGLYKNRVMLLLNVKK